MYHVFIGRAYSCEGFDDYQDSFKTIEEAQSFMDGWDRDKTEWYVELVKTLDDGSLVKIMDGML